MPSAPDKPSSRTAEAFTTGCLLVLVLLGDVFALLLVAIVLAVRGLGRTGGEPPQEPRPSGQPPTDWSPVLGWGVLGVVAAVTGLLFLRVGIRSIGTVQLAVGVVMAGAAISVWP
ncbi:inner-membrane translocator [Streptomyces spinosirectus]|uniref:inner-membrane translocator n=1 Tax=Streptomyces TaxID=1883 RepID=UPI001C9E199A|nr:MULTISPECIES: inner-membrane translocator [Streptomyces]MBY8339672.1 inner-membrane translocator [Streptomyces plumbidurans]UIR15744.1 inner-membrane translocator [Streptomyces spinosirectus]